VCKELRLAQAVSILRKDRAGDRRKPQHTAKIFVPEAKDGKREHTKRKIFREQNIK